MPRIIPNNAPIAISSDGELPQPPWEAPKKPQQVWFIKLLGANVNLGNIAWDEVTPLEALRIGLRGDTFFNFIKK